jgi:hypothetical protein
MVSALVRSAGLSATADDVSLPGRAIADVPETALPGDRPHGQPVTSAAEDLLADVQRCLVDAGFDLAGPGEGGLHLTRAGARVILTWRPREILLTFRAAGGRELSLGGLRAALHTAAVATLRAAGFIVEPGTGTQMAAVTGRNSDL